MARIYMRGFEDRSRFGDSYSNAGIYTSDIPGGGYCVHGKLNIITYSWYYARIANASLGSEYQEVYVRIYANWKPYPSSAYYTFGIADENKQAILDITKNYYPSGDLLVESRNGHAEGSIDSTYGGTNIWRMWEFYVKLGDSACNAIIRCDGEQVFSKVIDFSAYTNKHVVYAFFNNASPGQLLSADYGVWLDDIAVNDSTGTLQNTWPGPGHIIGIRPDSSGTYTQLTPVPDTGESNYEDVDDPYPDQSTTYVYATTSGKRDTYNFESIPDVITHPSITALSINITNKLSAAGPGTLKYVARLNGVEDAQNTGESIPSSDWDTQRIIIDNAPDGSAWSKSKIDACEFGYESA